MRAGRALALRRSFSELERASKAQPFIPMLSNKGYPNFMGGEVVERVFG
jgi:hypothetical protein